MTTPPRFTPPTTDPWRSFRGILSGILILEAIVILLAIPVIVKLTHGLTGWKVGYAVGLAVATFLGCVVVKRAWALPAFVALQLLVIAGWVIHPSIGVVGIMFLLVWLYVAYIKRDVAHRMENGQLAGQELIEPEHIRPEPGA